ncbi:hypothetical protein [Nostoc commune]|nr:hypothetical protein [Nostoc commune]
MELGIWQDRYQNIELPWLRWWDNQGNLLHTDGSDRSKQKRDRNAWLLN